MWKIWWWPDKVVRRLSFVFFFFWGLSPQQVCSQQSDWHSWYNVTVAGELTNKLSFTLEPELRLYENSGQLRSWQTELNMAYAVNKLIDLGGTYRYQVQYDNARFNERMHRIAIYTKLNYKIRRIKFRYRGMLQNEYHNWMSSTEGLVNYLGHRHKLSLKYSKKKLVWQPSVGLETYFSLRPASDLGEWKMRYFFNCDYKLTKHIGIKFSYKIQNEFGVKQADVIHITMIGIELKPRFIN